MNLIVVDPNVNSASPSMRAWLAAFPYFRHLFDKIEIWATDCALLAENGVTIRHFPQRLPHSILHGFDFERRVSAYQKSQGPTKNVLVQSTGCYVPMADIRYMHYWNRAMLEERARRPDTFRLHPVHRVTAELAARREKGVITNPQATNWWWVVSRSLANRMENESTGGKFRVLPNQYQPERFQFSVRDEWRNSMRQHYGFSEMDRVLVFSAFGHFERKGLLQAVEAINILRHGGHPARLLILGGKEKTIQSFRHKLSLKGIDASGCVFAGLVDQIERHLVAADGFLFPSHFEAFSLAEIEAAALGLRLYLTPHYGVEMILREPLNGRLLPWDPSGMAAVIKEDLENGNLGESHQETGEAIIPDQYRRKIISLYEEAIASKS